MNTYLLRSKLLAGAAVLCLLSGCLVPEKFSASVDMRTDGAYTYSYDGTATHWLAAAEIHKKGSLSDKTQHGQKAEADKLAKVPGVSRSVYEGGGRFSVALRQDVGAGQQPRLMKLVHVRAERDGTTTILVPPPKPKDVENFKQLGLKVEGTLEIRLPPDTKVLEHNATSTPGLMSKSYGWRIAGIERPPLIRVQLPR